MKRTALAGIALVSVIALSGCATYSRSPGVAMELDAGAPLARGAPMAREAEVHEPNRMLIWRAWLSLEVASVGDAVTQVADIAARSGGYVESRSDSGEEHAQIVLRVPADSLTAAVSSLETIGKVTRRRVASEDVTDQYVDSEARLKTLLALRDRLRLLLDKAQTVPDILAIEKELGRVQGDLDALQARLQALKGRVDLASVQVSLTRRRILGPLGYALKGVWWAVEKLFVIQE